MNIKTLFALFSALLVVSFISCNDDLNSIGGSIQPPSDTIAVRVDTIPLKARTISMRDSIYARTIYGVLGQYEDDLFGTIKSDYLCQFMFPKEAKFSDTFVKIDSVDFAIDFIKYYGDSLSPMGLTVYEVKKDLIPNFYTNVDPSDYADMNSILASRAYTIKGSDIMNSSTYQREIRANLGVPFGQAIYDAWKSGEIYDKASFNKFFPGMYVTTTSGTGSLINVRYSSIDIHYTHTYKDTANNNMIRDTTTLFSLSVTPEVYQLNQVKNKNPQELFVEGTDATYLKTPAGVYTEVTMPIKQIEQNMQNKNMSTINSVQFSVKGYTEKESDNSNFTLGRPNYLLLIPKDSVDTFFKGRKLPYSSNIKNSYAFVASRTPGSNTYSFGNISPLIGTYTKKNIDEVTYVILPVQLEYSSNSYGSSELVGVYNYMVPSTAVLRNDTENMRLELVYSKF